MHNAGAALLVMLVTMLNYRVKFQLDVARDSLSHKVATSASTH